MKRISIVLLACFCLACTRMDLAPADKAASGNWFQNAEQFEMCLNALLHQIVAVDYSQFEPKQLRQDLRSESLACS